MKEQVEEFFRKLKILIIDTYCIMTEDKGQVVSAGIVLLLAVFCIVFSFMGV